MTDAAASLGPHDLRFELPQRAGAAAQLAVFRALLGRDLTVAIRDFPTVVGQVIVQPLFLLFVFGKILPDLGYTQQAYSDLLFPGIVALTVLITAIQSTALPLVFELSYTMEIEDRLLAPLPTALVAIEKVVYSAMRALAAGALVFPVSWVMLGGIPWRASAIPMVIAIVVLGALTGAAMGLILGTIVTPSRVQTMFAIVLTPLMFTGSSQYPWLSLRHLRWFQVVSALNPLTYVSEGLRGSLEPAIPHIAPGLCVVVLAVCLAATLWAGTRSFLRRTIR